MDPKELKKLQEKLKKDQETLMKAQEILKTDQGTLEKAQETLEKAQETLESDRVALVTVDNNLQLAQKELSEGHLKLKKGNKVLETEKKRLGPLSVIEPVEELEVNPKWLKDSIFKGKKEGEAIKKPGKKTKTRVFIPFERPMETADVLSFRIDGNEVVLITADGQKLRVKK